MVTTPSPPPGGPPALPSVARWQLDRRDASLRLTAEALAWFGLADLDPRGWKAQLLPRIAPADRSRWIDAMLVASDGGGVDCQIATTQPAPSRLLRLIAQESGGDIVGGLLIDVSRDVREREALLELAGLQRSFIDALPWPTCAFDDQGDVVLANRLWRRCADCAVQIGDQSIALPALPEWLARQVAADAGARERTSGRLLAVRLVDSKGNSQPAWLRRSAIRQAGTPLHLVSVESRPETP